MRAIRKVVDAVSSVAWRVIGVLNVGLLTRLPLRFIAYHATKAQLSFIIGILRDLLLPVFTCALGVATLREEARQSCEDDECTPEVAAALGVGLEAATTALETTLDTVLREWDGNADGVVTLKEAVQALSQPASPRQAQIRAALEAATRAQRAATEARIALDAATVAAVALVEEVPALDDDGDGDISFGEIWSWPGRVAQRWWGGDAGAGKRREEE